MRGKTKDVHCCYLTSLVFYVLLYFHFSMFFFCLFGIIYKPDPDPAKTIQKPDPNLADPRKTGPSMRQIKQ